MPNFTTLLNTVTLSEFSDLVKKQFSIVQQRVKPVASELYIYEDLTGWSSDQKRYDELDTETFAKLKRQGENAAKVRAGIGYSKTMTAKRVAAEIDITWEMRRYGNEHRVKSELYSLNNFVIQRTELDLSHRFTFASATSYTDMDGETVDTTMGDTLAAASTVHTLKHSSATYSTRVSGDPAFSQGALELAESLFVSDILSNFGERRIIEPNTIISTDDPATCRAIRQVLESTSDVDAAHAGVINTYKMKYKHVKLPYWATTATGGRDATKKRSWALASVGNGINSLQAYYGVFEAANMKTPTAGSNLEDGHNDNWTYGTRGSYGVCWVSAKGIVFSLPTN
jgi:hypothetical protein